MKKSLCVLLLAVLVIAPAVAEGPISDAMLQELSRMQPRQAEAAIKTLPAEQAVAYGVALFQLWMREGRNDDAEAILESSRRIAAGAGMNYKEAELLATQAFLMQRRGEVREAIALVRRAIEGYRRSQAIEPQLTMLMFLGNLQHRLGALTAALETMEELTSRRDQIDDQLFYADALTEAGMLRYKTGRLDRLPELLDEALEIYREHDQQNGIGTVYRIYGNYHNALRDPRTALDYYERARGYYVRTNNVHDYANISFNIGIVYVGLGAAEDAVSYFENAIENFAAAGSFSGAGMAGTELARALFTLNRFSEAQVIVEQARRHLESSQAFRRLAQAHTIYAAIRFAQGREDDALEAYREALAIYRELGLSDDAQHVLELINRVRDGSHRGLGI
ncbi:MAG: hypothetical protein EA384_10335 [Spirochaetaceae bacterium]|nr:MAG: hypothetical protein EA384_10335 [Spirochaetaceae bacterium]